MNLRKNTPNKVNITPRAKADLRNIWQYTQKAWGEAQADHYVKNIYKRFEWIAIHPRAGRHRPDIRHGYYCFGQGQHLIFYLIQKNAIDIIAVPHRSMDIAPFFDE